jgi:hypothetical protein
MTTLLKKQVTRTRVEQHNHQRCSHALLHPGHVITTATPYRNCELSKTTIHSSFHLAQQFKIAYAHKLNFFVHLTLSLLMPRYLAQPFNVIKWQLKFNLAA